MQEARRQRLSGASIGEWGDMSKPRKGKFRAFFGAVDVSLCETQLIMVNAPLGWRRPEGDDYNAKNAPANLPPERFGKLA